MDASSLRSKIEWEGGVIGALDYGIRADDIDDDDLSSLWQNLADDYADFADDIASFEDLLDSKAEEPDED